MFNFLTRFVEECDTQEMSEAQAFLAIPHFLTGTAERHYRAAVHGGKSGGVSCWPEAVQYFLRTYATAATISSAIRDLRDIRQQSNETELEYAARINDAAYRCGGVHGETEKMDLFVEGLLPSTRTMVSRHRESQPRWSLTYDSLVRFAREEGENHRARTTTARGQKIIIRQKRGVNFVEPQSPTGQDEYVDEEVHLIDGDSLPTDELPSGTSQETVLYVDNHGSKTGNTRLVAPQRVPFDASHNRPGWAEKKPGNVICHGCYQKGHISPDCSMTLARIEEVVTNYDKLSDIEKTRVPNTAYNSARGYLASILRTSKEGKTETPQSKN